MENKSLTSEFAGSIPRTSDDIDEALRVGLLSLDANVLLDFYRHTSAGRAGIPKVLLAAGDRVWVSHQAAREFWRNRCGVIDRRRNPRIELEASFDDALSKASGAARKWGKRVAASDDVIEQVTGAILGGVDSAKSVAAEHSTDAENIDYEVGDDPVCAMLDDLLSNRVGADPGCAERKRQVEEGRRRARESEPPGYLDWKEKEKRCPDGAAGDYLVWRQSMDEACRTGLPLVMVTAEEKEDWWTKHEGSLLGPRQELIDEYWKESGRLLVMLRTRQLIEHANSLGVELDEGETVGGLAGVDDLPVYMKVADDLLGKRRANFIRKALDDALDAAIPEEIAELVDDPRLIIDHIAEKASLRIDHGPTPPVLLDLR